MKAADPDLLWASVLSFVEIRKGIELLPQSRRRTELKQWLERDLHEWFEDRRLPITDAIADRWGFLSAEAQTRGKPLANIDGLIAATALEHDPSLVTRNVRHFSNLGVTTLDPWESF